MPALHAVPACDAAPDLNVEPPHDWLDDGQVFLVLGRDASGLNRPTTARARHGKRRGIRLIHPRRNRSPAATSIGGTCPPARSPAATLRAVLRKRGGLSKARAPRRVELLLETLASSLPSIAIACRAGQLVTQAGNLILVALDQLVAFVARRSRTIDVGRIRVSDTFLVAEPQANVLFRLTDWFRISVGAGYRLVGATDVLEDRLNGFTGTVGFQFGL